MAFAGFNYSLDEGLSVEEEDAIDRAINTYGFLPDALIPGLAQYQTMQGGFNHRKVVGSTAQISMLFHSMNNLVLWCNKYSNPGQGLVTSTAARRTMLTGAAVPRNPFGMTYKLLTRVSIAIVYADIVDYGLNFGFLGPAKKSFNEQLEVFAKWGMFQ